MTTLSFALSAEADVELLVHDVCGRLVTVLASGSFPAGQHIAVWDGRDSGGRGVASGIYFYSLEVGESRERRKMVLLK